MIGKRNSDKLGVAAAAALRWFGILLTEGRWHTDDKTFAGGELLGQVDLITGGTFDEVDIWDGITDFDHIGGSLVEGSNGFEV